MKGRCTRMKLKSGAVEQFEQFSQFQSLTEFHHHMEMWLVDYKREFTKKELIGLEQLVRISVVIPGVSSTTIANMVKEIQESDRDHGISRDTFKRMLGKAKRLGILTVYETVRSNGSQDSNLYMFNRFPQSKNGIDSEN